MAGISVTERLMLLPAVSLVLGKTLTAAVGGLYSTNGAPTYGEHVANALGRAFLSGFTTTQLQWLLPPSSQTYKAYCRKNNLVPDICKVGPSNTECFWLGDKSKAKYNMVFYHGGGWVLPGNDHHFEMVSKWVRWSNNNLAVLFVDYTLSPGAPYPIALGQCVDALRHVLELPGRSPSTTLLGGDSAGGNLVLATLGHLSHPHPQSDIVKPLPLTSKLMGTIVVDPWISNATSHYKSFKKFANRDIFPIPVVQYWSAAYEGPRKTLADENYLWPSHADASWWKDSKSKTMLATIGEHEGLLDCVLDFAKKYEEGAGQRAIELFVGKNETHIAPLVAQRTDEQLVGLEEVVQEAAIKQWIERNLG